MMRRSTALVFLAGFACAGPKTDLTGEQLFKAELSTDQGFGPLYNDRSCVACHMAPSPGGMGMMGLATVTVIGVLLPSGYDPDLSAGGPLSRKHSVVELQHACSLSYGIPSQANITSVRNAPALFGAGAIDQIPDAEIIAQSVAKSSGVHGRPHHVLTFDKKHRIGRFGWKGKIATLHEFVGIAFRNELGVTNPVAPRDLFVPEPGGKARCAGDLGEVEDDGTMVLRVADYVASLPAPDPMSSGTGRNVFDAAGCGDCHVPSLHSPAGDVPLFSDLLLHDMGPTLNDNVIESDAKGAEWRTTPLWGLHMRTRFLHDGRASSILEAIQNHDGEAKASLANVMALSNDQLKALLAFLSGL